MDPYPILGLVAEATQRIRLGTLVTNPVSRHPTVTASALATLNEISGGRMDLGIGRGDSAVRLVGDRPASIDQLERAIAVIRALVGGRTVTLDGVDIQLPWASPRVLPVWIAGYGPKVIDLAARVADGAIFQLADPEILTPLIERLREREAAAGRRPGSVKVMVAAPAFVGALDEGIERTSWFPRFIRHHIDEVLRQPTADVPSGYSAFVDASDGEGFRDLVRRTCFVGEADLHLERLRQLQAIGVAQVNLYLMDGGQDRAIESYRTSVIPQLVEDPDRSVAPA